jgi:triacylglycerol lipase
MLAHLQRLIVFTWCVALIAWPAWQLAAGRPGWALAGVVLLLIGHALVLALEFLLMHRVNRTDAAPRASLGQLITAWAGESLGALRVFGWRQPFRSGLIPDHLPPGPRRGVLFLHGFVCNRGLWNPWLKRLKADGVPFVAVNLEPIFGSIDDYLPLIEQAVARLEAATGRPPIAVAHSMGGLALRRWWAEPGNDGRIVHAITIGTPHHGTWLARFAMSTNSREMRQGSRWLQDLRAAEPAGRGARFTCFYGHCDNIVFPASTAVLPGAEARHLPGVAHVHMADHAEPWCELTRRLQD